MTDETRDAPDWVICVGLSCVDLLLLQADRPPRHDDDLVQFSGVRFAPGGGVYHTLESMASTLRASGGKLGPSAVQLRAITLVGADRFGRFYSRCVSENVAPEAAQTILFTDTVNTGVSVVPVYLSGGRGCYVDLGANRALATEAVLRSISALPIIQRSGAGAGSPGSVVLHLAYPHLLPQLQGDHLVDLVSHLQCLLAEAAEALVLSLDVNGATKRDSTQLGSAFGIPEFVFQRLDILHANYEEACTLLDEEALTESPTWHDPTLQDRASNSDKLSIRAHGRRLLERLKERILESSHSSVCDERLLVIAVTLGRRGAWVFGGPRKVLMQLGCTEGQFVPPPTIQENQKVNPTGAGDSFTAGLCLGYLRAMRERSHPRNWHERSPDEWTRFFAELALQSVSRKITAEVNLHVDL